MKLFVSLHLLLMRVTKEKKDNSLKIPLLYHFKFWLWDEGNNFLNIYFLFEIAWIPISSFKSYGQNIARVNFFFI